MVFLLKKKNKYKKTQDNHNLEKLKLIFSKVKYVAKNVIYIKNWSDGYKKKFHVIKKNDETFNNYSNFSEQLSFTYKNFSLKLVNHPHSLLEKAKKLRYKSFFGDPLNEKLDSDEFDKECDHLLVIDKNIASDFVVGTYRLLNRQTNNLKKKFYSETEFDISNLLKIKNISILEAGRSCVHENYRDGRIIKLLWKGLAYYILKKKIDLIFGCASFPSSNYTDFERQLSYLNSYHKPPKKYSTFPLQNVEAKYNFLSSDDLSQKDEFRLLPPLIKAYIRVGAWIGKGAVVDKKFNTTDVLVILKAKNIIRKYSNLSF